MMLRWICTATLLTVLYGIPATAAEPPGTRFGIAVQPIRITAAGHLIDLRYRVTDPAKAKDLFAAGVRPRLVHEASGSELATPSFPKVGALRQGSDKFQANRIYFVMFENRDHRVGPGDTVTLIVGQTRIEHLLVY